MTGSYLTLSEFVSSKSAKQSKPSIPPYSRGNQLEGELMAGSLDQLGEGTKTRITLVAFICADHRLCDTGPLRKIGLRQASSTTSLTDHRSRTRIHPTSLSRIVYKQALLPWQLFPTGCQASGLGATGTCCSPSR